MTVVISTSAGGLPPLPQSRRDQGNYPGTRPPRRSPSLVTQPQRCAPRKGAGNPTQESEQPFVWPYELRLHDPTISQSYYLRTAQPSFSKLYLPLVTLIYLNLPLF